MTKSNAIVLYDVSRLVNRRRSRIATGVDRIDVMLAGAVFERFGTASIPVALSAGRPVVLRRQKTDLLEMVAGLGEAWFAGKLPPEAVNRRIDRLGIASGRGYGPSRGAGAAADKPNQSYVEQLEMLRDWTLSSMAKGITWLGGKKIEPSRRIIYVNASHEGLPRVRGALGRLSSNISVVAYVHDIIPILYPEYTRPDQVGRFEGFLAELQRHRTTYVANSISTASSLQRHLARNDDSRVAPHATPSHTPFVVYPGINASTSVADLQPTDRNPPAFVMLGTIEPRKNHLMILNIWRDFVNERAPFVPHLHIIGRRGWSLDCVSAMLDRCKALGGYVTEHRDLSDAAVSTLLRKSRALLFPSFAEGFGFPLVEAAKIGVPVIGADLPVFRELVEEGGVWLHPLDAASWKIAIDSACSSPNPISVPRLRDDLGDWQHQARQFTDIVENVLQGTASTARRST